MKLSWIQDAIQDFRHGTRALARTPVFAAVTILIIALGIGVNTAVFALVDRALLAPLPFYRPGELFVLYQKTPMTPRFSVSYPNFLDWQKQNHGFAIMAAGRPQDVIFSAGGKSEYVHAAMISPELFETLGIHPLAGRSFTSQDDQPGAGRVALLDEDFWQERFGGVNSAVGSVLRLKGTAYTIVGIVPRSLHALGRIIGPARVYLPLGQWDDPSFRNRKVTTGMLVVARRKTGIADLTARADLERLAANLSAAYPDENRDIGITMEGLQETLVFRVRTALLAMLGAVGFVWLIALANVANLALVRSLARSQEFATRVALGADAPRLTRQLLAENFVLALAGGSLGLLLNTIALKTMISKVPADIPGAREAGLDARAIICGFGLCLLATLAGALLPGLKIFGGDLVDSLKDGARSSTARGRTTQGFFVAAQMSLALVLLAGSGLMIRSIANLWRSRPGFDPRNVLTFSVVPPPKVTGDAAAIRAFFRGFTDRVQTVRGVEAAAIVLDPLPLSGLADVVQLQREGQREQDAKRKTSAIWYFVGPKYFAVMHTPLRRGRLFTEHDDESAPRVMLIDENMARSIFGDENPLGKRLDVDFVGLAEVVGVVGHVNHWNPGADPDGFVTREMYFPYTQLADKWLKLGTTAGASVIARTHGEPLAFVGAIRSQTRIDAEQAVYGERSMDQIFESWMETRRFLMALLSLFATLALALAAAGIYGALSHAVGQRTNEFGIRMALGAQQGQVLRLVLSFGGRLFVAGIVAGTAIALMLARWISGFLYGVHAGDPVTFVVAALILLVVAAGACWVPARAAMRIDPLRALRR